MHKRDCCCRVLTPRYFLISSWWVRQGFDCLDECKSKKHQTWPFLVQLIIIVALTFRVHVVSDEARLAVPRRLTGPTLSLYWIHSDEKNTLLFLHLSLLRWQVFFSTCGIVRLKRINEKAENRLIINNFNLNNCLILGYHTDQRAGICVVWKISFYCHRSIRWKHL